MSDILFDYGVQYDWHLDKTRKVTFGVTYANKFMINAKRDYLSTTLLGGYGELVEYVIDTIVYTPEEKGKLVMPQKIGFGLAYQKFDRWIIGADFEWQNWESYLQTLLSPYINR